MSIKLSVSSDVKLPAMFHISEKNINGTILTPRVPDNEFIKWGVEDGTTKRVSFGGSVSKCLLALGRNVSNKKFYVFVPDTEYTSPKKLLESIVYPSREQVPDVHLTHEIWCTCPVKLKYKMMIEVTGAGKEYKLIIHRKDTDEDVVGKPCEWEWKRFKTPVEDLKELFAKIRYGWRNPKTGKPFKSKEEFDGKEPGDVWRLGTPEQTIKAEVGNCYDTVAMSQERLKKKEMNIQFRMFWMCVSGDKFMESPCHTFLIYWDTDDEWKWLEGSWGPFKNNDWHAKNPKDLIKWIGTAMANMENANIDIHELSNYPPYGCDMQTFETTCRKASKIMSCKPDKSASTESLKTTTKEEAAAGIKKAKAILEKLHKFKAVNNCQKFAAAVELAYRGVDVEVTPTMRPDARVFDVPVGRKSPYANWCLIRNGEFTKIKKDDPLKFIEDTMLKWGEGSRAIIAVTWTGSHAGHVFNLTVIDGKVYLLDGTANRFKEIHDSDYLKKNVDAERSTGLLRSDKGSIDRVMKDDTFSDEEDEFSTDDDDKKYPSVLHLLHIHGEKGRTFTIYRNDKKIGIVRCDSIEHTYGKFSTVWNYSWR